MICVCWSFELAAAVWLVGHPLRFRFVPASPLLRKGEGWWRSPSVFKGKTLLLDVQGENTHPSPLMLKGELKGV